MFVLLHSGRISCSSASKPRCFPAMFYSRVLLGFTYDGVTLGVEFPTGEDTLLQRAPSRSPCTRKKNEKQSKSIPAPTEILQFDPLIYSNPDTASKSAYGFAYPRSPVLWLEVILLLRMLVGVAHVPLIKRCRNQGEANTPRGMTYCCAPQIPADTSASGHSHGEMGWELLTNQEIGRIECS